ncbi:MAG TPA: hypothetical protein VH851_02280 [Candidatus Binatia bacterium]
MKFAVLTAVVVAANLACALASDTAESTKQPERIVARPAPPPEPKKLPATRRMLIERMKAFREYLRQSLPHYERKLAAQTAEVQNHRTLYEQNVISQREFDSSQQTMTNTELKADRIRHRIAEDDVALSPVEGNARAEIGALRKPAPNVYEETPTVIRYNGATPWSPALIVKVAKFFNARFNKELPISAVGQSLTHERLGYDHREAIDVAVSPQSREGRGLIAYLRRARIPFRAFRDKVPGVSTGPHIHIGMPSPRCV